MTVLVRPVPRRVSANGIRPFRPNIPANNIRPYTVKTWRPPVPEPLPPAPLLGPKELLGLGALVLVQIWGWLSSRPKTKGEASTEDGSYLKGSVPPQGNAVGGDYTVDRAGGTYEPVATDKCESGGVLSAGDWREGVYKNVVSVAHYTVPRPCGPREIGVKLTKTDGSVQTVVWLSTTFGFKKIDLSWTGSWSGPGAVPFVPAAPPIPLPDGYQPPQVEPDTETKPKPLPPLPLPGVPVPAPQPEPGTDPMPAPGPGPARPPIAPPIVSPRPGTRPLAPGSTTPIGGDGKLPLPGPAEVPTTNPDAHFPFPGSKPITGNGPQAKPEEIAKELGRIEEKLARIMSPEADTGIEWKNWVWQILEALFEQTQGRTYTLTEKCPPCDGSDYTPATVQATASPGLSGIGTLSNKVDAIAALLDGQLGLKQQICPPCKPTVRGELVTINFQSDPEEVPSRYAVKKILRYRDQSGRDEDFHAQHWAGFSWQTGGQIVTSKGLSWGIVSCWAFDRAEGQRVIAHAATAAGVNLNDPKHEWVFSSTTHPRYGRQAEVWPVTYDPTGKLMISKRSGPSGLPAWKRDT